MASIALAAACPHPPPLPAPVFQDGVKALVEKGYKKITPFFIPYAITNMGAPGGGVGGTIDPFLAGRTPGHRSSCRCPACRRRATGH